MKITADTNILVRAITGDHPAQSKSARNLLSKAELIAVTLPALCEVVWVLSRGHGEKAAGIADAITRLMNSDNVSANRPAVEAGLKALIAGGDFADGVIAHEGRWLGAETFASFDKQAVTLVGRQMDAMLVK